MNKIEGQNSGFGNIKNNLSKRVGAGILAVTLAMGGFGGENRAKANLTLPIETPAMVPSLSDDEIATILSLSLENEASKRQEIAQYYKILKEKGCQEINLEICAAGLNARNKSEGFKDPQVFDQWQKTILGNYVTDEQFYEFGRTGKGLDVVYFKDKNGKKTKEPAFFYIANPENKKFKVGDIEKGIDAWEKVAPGFLRVLVENGVRILFQSQASSNKKINVFKYEYITLYYNTSRNESDMFTNGVAVGMPVEMFGVKGDALGGEFDKYAVGVIKSRLAVDCCKYIVKKTGNKKIAGLVENYQIESDMYTESYWTDRGKSEEELLSLIKIVKDNNLMTPFGAETWEEIDSVANPKTN